MIVVLVTERVQLVGMKELEDMFRRKTTAWPWANVQELPGVMTNWHTECTLGNRITCISRFGVSIEEHAVLQWKTKNRSYEK